MTVRVGVDVGGTFTKAVALDVATGRIVADAVVPTTHRAVDGIAEGVVRSLMEVNAAVTALNAGPVALVGHSTSLAVNALLEGDLPRVGLLGIGWGREARLARRRTDVRRIRLGPGRDLAPIYRFVSARPLTPALARDLVDEIRDAGAESLAISAAFAVESPDAELLLLDAARSVGLMACAGHQLTRSLGLELRTRSAVLNAAILPIASRTANVVAEGLQNAGLHAPLLVLRGDGGATDLRGFAALPIQSLYSGPAASVVGALHRTALPNAFTLEVGGTSSNVALLADGRPGLADVRVGDNGTTLRALDVRVAATAGGSMVRVHRDRVVGVGPRSAHIAGLRYACFADPADLQDARAVVVSPTPGDPGQYLAVDASGGRFALTATCAANALGLVGADDYAVAPPGAATAAFAVAGHLLGMSGVRLARLVIDGAAAELARAVRAVAGSRRVDLRRLPIIAIGGGGGVLVPAVARLLDMRVVPSPDGPVLSSVGAATSLIRAVAERSVQGADDAALSEAVRAAEREALAIGAAPHSIETTTEFDESRGLVRAVATGRLPLEMGSAPGVDVDLTGAAEPDVAGVVAGRLGVPIDRISAVGRNQHYRAYAARHRDGQRLERWALVDQHGRIAHAGELGDLLTGSARVLRDRVGSRIHARRQRVGPLTIAPPTVVVAGTRLIDCRPLTDPAAVLALVERELAAIGDDPAFVAIERDAA